MTRGLIMHSLVFLAALGAANAYWLMGIEDFITTERLDPIVNPGKVSGHVHSVLGGSNFGFNVTTAKLRESECTSIPIPQDNSNYWFPHLYFQWNNGSFSSLNGGAVIYYLFDNPATGFHAFPDDFRMISGDPTLRSYNASSYAQQAVTFLCLDFNGVTTKHNELPSGNCPSGVRAQINFPSCWDGKNLDSSDHKSHVAFLSGGPDSGTCSDPNYPVRLVRVFMEVYWDSGSWSPYYNQAKNSSQPFVFSNGDSTGYGYHADFYNGWQPGVLQNAINKCNCNEYGDPTCCAQAGIFDMNQGKTCRITRATDEQTTGTIPKLPGNNPVVGYGPNAAMSPSTTTPAIIAPVFAYTGDSPTATGNVVTPAQTGSGSTTTTTGTPASSPTSTAGSSNSADPSKTSTPTSTSSGSSPTSSSSTSSSGSSGGSNNQSSGSSSGSTGGSNPPASGNQSSGSSSTSSSGSTGGSNPPASGNQGSSGSTNGSSPPASGGSSSNSSSPSSGSNAGGYGGSSSSSGSSNAGSNGGGSSSSASSSTSTSSPATTSSSTTTGSHNTGSGSTSPSSGGGSNSDPSTSSPANGSEPASGSAEDEEPTCSPKKKSKKPKKSTKKSSFSQHHARRRFHTSMMKI